MTQSFYLLMSRQADQQPTVARVLSPVGLTKCMLHSATRTKSVRRASRARKYYIVSSVSQFEGDSDEANEGQGYRAVLAPRRPMMPSCSRPSMTSLRWR
jgi:hypothetical protein